MIVGIIGIVEKAITCRGVEISGFAAQVVGLIFLIFGAVLSLIEVNTIKKKNK